MNTVLEIIIFSFISGFTILIGATLAHFIKINNTRLRQEFIHGAIAFGGGVLIAAVAFALTPKAIESLSIYWLTFIFIMGTLTFFCIDLLVLSKKNSFAQSIAMLMDYIPEAIALGAAFAHHIEFGILLALFIGLQNLPEGFNSYDELLKKGYSVSKSFMILIPLSLIGVIVSLLGYYFLTDYPKIIAGIMLFAGGGIIYLMFQDIAPLSKTKISKVPALGASLGFLLGMLGEKLLLG